MGKQACVHLYLGDGKGKTTCGVGLAVRAAGHGYTAAIIHLLKPNGSGEDKFIAAVGQGNLTVHSCEAKRGFYPFLSPEEQRVVHAEQRQTLALIAQLMEQSPFLLVLDEILDSVALGIITPDELTDLINTAQKRGIELVLTGREAPPAILQLADYITEFKKGKHPYDTGLLAREGIEY